MNSELGLQDVDNVQAAMAHIQDAMLFSNEDGITLTEIASALVTMTKRTLVIMIERSPAAVRETNRQHMIDAMLEVVSTLCTTGTPTNYRGH